MYHVLIVDDEPLMRTYLAKSIPQFDEQFDVCGTAADGQEAIEYLKAHIGKVDVIITDIKMPEVDGLTLAGYVSARFPEIVLIIISGFSDFEYARKAIQYNVTDYLLKPLQDKSLIELLHNVAMRLTSMGRKSSFYPTSKLSGGHILRCELVRAILDGDSTQAYRAYEELGNQKIAAMGPAGCIVKCHTLYAGHLQNDGIRTVSSCFELNLFISDICASFDYITLCSKSGDTYIMIDGNSPADLERKASSLYRVLKEQAKRPRQFDFHCGQAVSDIMLLPQSMRSLDELQFLSFLSKDNMLLPSVRRNSEVIKGVKGTVIQILQDISSGRPEELKVHVNAFCKSCICQDKACYWRAGEYLILQAEMAGYAEASEIQRAYQTLSNIYTNQAAELRTSESYITYIKILNQTLLQLIPGESHSAVQEMPVIRRAKEFILEHYRENISLQDVAEFCGVSVSYLSNLFHKQLGISYSKYLLKLRMDEASKLLSIYPDMKIYDVAERTGFITAKHFIAVFKKNFGVSPSNFQKSIK